MNILKYILITLFVIFLLFFVNFCFASDQFANNNNMVLDNLDIKVVSDTKIPCETQALGCFRADTQVIYLDYRLEGELLKWVLTHELGHFLAQDIKQETYREIWDNNILYMKMKEICADKFIDYIWYPFLLNKKEINFFNQLIINL